MEELLVVGKGNVFLVGGLIPTSNGVFKLMRQNTVVKVHASFLHRLFVRRWFSFLSVQSSLSCQMLLCDMKTLPNWEPSVLIK